MGEFLFIAIVVYVIYKIAMNNRMSTGYVEPKARKSTIVSEPMEPRVIFIRSRTTGDIIMDERNQLFKIKGVNFKVFGYEDLLKYELNEDGQSITSGGLSIGRAIVGNLAIGGAGMIMGGVTGSRKSKDIVTNMHIALTITGKNKGYYRIPFIEKKTKKHSKEYKKQLELARETLAALDIMVSEI